MSSKPPTAKQLAYLRALSERVGQTFAMPRTRQEASAEIRRLKAAPVETRLERRISATRSRMRSAPERRTASGSHGTKSAAMAHLRPGGSGHDDADRHRELRRTATTSAIGSSSAGTAPPPASHACCMASASRRWCASPTSPSISRSRLPRRAWTRGGRLRGPARVGRRLSRNRQSARRPADVHDGLRIAARGSGAPIQAGTAYVTVSSTWS